MLFLLPPGLLISIAILGFIVYSKWIWAGTVIIVLSLALLIALSLPLTSRQLTASLESFTQPLYPEALDEVQRQAKAIVVIGGGRYPDAPEYGSDTVSRLALERVRYGAHLHRQTGLPILVSGGARHGETIPEAELMWVVLEKDYNITPRWKESRSRTTWENAILSGQLLRAGGIDHVLLVTHAWHMRRAVWSFESTGLRVTAAPTGFTTPSNLERGIYGYLPSAYGLYWSNMALREQLGYLWYRMAYQQEQSKQIAPRRTQPAAAG